MSELNIQYLELVKEHLKKNFNCYSFNSNVIKVVIKLKFSINDQKDIMSMLPIIDKIESFTTIESAEIYANSFDKEDIILILDVSNGKINIEE